MFHRKQKTELLIIPSKNFLKCFPKRSWLLIEAPPLIWSVMVVFVKPFLWKRFVKIWAVQGRERWTIPPFKPLSGLPAPSPPPLPILSLDLITLPDTAENKNYIYWEQKIWRALYWLPTHNCQTNENKTKNINNAGRKQKKIKSLHGHVWQPKHKQEKYWFFCCIKPYVG